MTRTWIARLLSLGVLVLVHNAAFGYGCKKAYFDRVARDSGNGWVEINTGELAFNRLARKEIHRVALLSKQGGSVDGVRAVYLSGDQARIASLTSHYRDVARITAELDAMVERARQASTVLRDAKAHWQQIADSCQQQQLYDGYGKAKNNIVVVQQHITRSRQLLEAMAGIQQEFKQELALLTQARRSLLN